MFKRQNTANAQKASKIIIIIMPKTVYASVRMFNHQLLDQGAECYAVIRLNYLPIKANV